MGRLHTRYSPVRRSPPASYPAALPLDLHVLSLSLAFILSQDQTLRCCLSFFLFFSDKKTQTVFSRPMVASWRGLPPPVLILSHCRIISMSFVLLRASVAPPCETSPFWRCECKGTANQITHQTFLQLFCVKFSRFSSTRWKSIK